MANNRQIKNKFCELSTLRNESDVEQFFVYKLIKDLGFEDRSIFTKSKIDEFSIGKGRKKKGYRPDYILYLDNNQQKPVVIIDAKGPDEDVNDGVNDAQLYVAVLRRQIKSPKPEQYCIGINGYKLIVKEYESNEIKLELNFEDFEESNQKYQKLKSILSYEALKSFYESNIKFSDVFEFKRPPRTELNGIFRACHNLIWKKEKKKPTEAFYEFAKLFFIKLFYDRKINKEILKQKKVLGPEDVIFSVRWIEKQERELSERNPVNSILFKNIREDLEKEIEERKKKRIFKKEEPINLQPSTIKEVVRQLEHLNLFGIDEELNGRMFENFLSATVRGKDLGQFFTPRSVVKFMTKLAELKVDDRHIDRVLDAFCGSGGFLIEAMADMFSKIEAMKIKTDIEKRNLKDEVVKNYLWGMDADKGELLPISRVARMNMYLHGDGSNRIYWVPDSLDKEMYIEETDRELKEEAESLKKEIKDGLQFDVVLTNPPFSMKYEKKDKNEKRILEQYEIAVSDKGLRSSLNSNILSIERYKDLLKPHGRYITIIDESVLNTETAKDFRDYIRKYFIIRAIISLPRNAFVNADTNVKTSILYLIKKEKIDESQPPIFMAISNSVGHTDAGKEDLKNLDLYQEQDENGTIINNQVGKTILEEYFNFIKNV